MTIKELDDKLNSPRFQNPENGDMYYNLFVYQYPPEKEYEIRRQIREFKENLIRPLNYVDVLTLDLFKEFCEFLGKEEYLRGQSMLDFLLENELKHPERYERLKSTLSRNAESDKFVQYLHERIIAHVTIEDEYRRPFVFIYGVGSIFPYLRVNKLLAKYENYDITNKYRIVVFYPGHREGNTFRLFDTLQDNNTYRAHLLINE